MWLPLGGGRQGYHVCVARQPRAVERPGVRVLRAALGCGAHLGPVRQGLAHRRSFRAVDVNGNTGQLHDEGVRRLAQLDRFAVHLLVDDDVEVVFPGRGDRPGETLRGAQDIGGADIAPGVAQGRLGGCSQARHRLEGDLLPRNGRDGPLDRDLGQFHGKLVNRLADPLPGAVLRPEDLHLHLVVAGRRGLGLEGIRRVGKAHPGAHVAPLEAIDGGRLGHDGKLHFRLQDDRLAQFHLVRPRDAHGRAALLQDLLPVALQERGSLRVVLLRVGDDIAAPRRVLLEGAAPHPLPDLLPGKRLQGVPVEGRIEGRCGHALALDLQELLLCVGPRLQDELVPPGGRLLVRLDLSGEEAGSR